MNRLYHTEYYSNSFLLLLLSVILYTGNEAKDKMGIEDSSTPLNRSDFQTVINGKQTDLFFLENHNGIKVAITNYGGRIVSLMVPDHSGNYNDIVLGFDSIDGYLNANEVYFGALIGRYGNRIANGLFTLGDRQYVLDRNNNDHHLHGGPGGFHNVVWDADLLDNQTLRLRYVSEDGEEGYPGTLTVQVLYSLLDKNELRIEYTAFSDKETVVNLTNHAFFNLKGASSGTINEHILMLNAESYTPVDAGLIPTGAIEPVENTPFDFRHPVEIGDRVNDNHPQLEFGLGYDHNFVLNKEYGKLGLAAKVYEPESRRTMEIYTTEPGIQFYGGNFLDGSDTGKEGNPYEYRSAFCLEPQHFPDSPNQPDFPRTLLKPGEIYHSVSSYRFYSR